MGAFLLKNAEKTDQPSELDSGGNTRVLSSANMAARISQVIESTFYTKVEPIPDFLAILKNY